MNESLPDTTSRGKQMMIQFRYGRYECSICLSPIGIRASIWNCQQCFKGFHLTCLKKWAISHQQQKQGDITGSNQWQCSDLKRLCCPACRQWYSIIQPDRTASSISNTTLISNTSPSLVTALSYRCFCGKLENPPVDRFLTPHACGDVCQKNRLYQCPHPCTALCHPGPCDPCGQTKTVLCPCGSNPYSFPCGTEDPLQTCKRTCSKSLNCGKHVCEQTCHHGPCTLCTLMEERSCFCGRVPSLSVPCGSSKDVGSCHESCSKELTCGHHTCSLLCHAGPCPPCDNDPSIRLFCGCGKVSLSSNSSEPLLLPQRSSCLDPIPSCGQICGKQLTQCSRQHVCKAICHSDPCAICTIHVEASCRCGHQLFNTSCHNIPNLRCQRVCKTKLSCGRHDCRQICCNYSPPMDEQVNRCYDSIKHICQQLCQRRLPCGRHDCEAPCHTGSCPSCYHVVAETLSCRCGAETRHPPQPCGTELPTCSRPCLLGTLLPCGHLPHPHTCHFGQCPPCIQRISCLCYGGHTTLPNMLCSQVSSQGGGVSCGQTCHKALPSCLHTCLRRCHPGDCENSPCTQPCGRLLSDCPHACSLPCHDKHKSCDCSAVITLHCPCGVSNVSLSCQFAREKLRKLGNDFLKDGWQPLTPPCTRKCLLGIVDKEISEEDKGIKDDSRSSAGAVAKGFVKQQSQEIDQRFKNLSSSSTLVQNVIRKTLYTFSLWSIASESPHHIHSVEQILGHFVQSTETIRMLPTMSPGKRSLIHQLAPFYTIQTVSLDHGSQRSITLSRCQQTHIPSTLLSEAVSNTKDDASPYRIAQQCLSQQDLRGSRLVIVEGLPETLTVSTLNSLLFTFAGHYLLLPYTTVESFYKTGNLAWDDEHCEEDSKIPKSYLRQFNLHQTQSCFVLLFPDTAKAKEALGCLRQSSSNRLVAHGFGSKPLHRNNRFTDVVKAICFIGDETWMKQRKRKQQKMPWTKQRKPEPKKQLIFCNSFTAPTRKATQRKK